MEFKKLSSPSLKELFIKEMETLILSGRLAIGEKLPPEREIAKSMQISRTVVNAGISELARKGFLTIKPRMGTFVADYRKNGNLETLISIMNYNSGMLRKAEIRSVLELRIALDKLAIESLIPKVTEEDIKTLRGYVEKMKEAETLREVSELAFSFQHELALLSGNTLLPLIFMSFKELVLNLWERFCRLYGKEALYNNTSVLCDHIEQRDAAKAVEWQTAVINETISGSRQIYY
ncbi:MAG TPA: FadR family transcriptional regulator [Clostridiaceae bacterium]|nr:FadR family transcriptional regulator [Clostridiaceae bacterium]